MSHFHLFSHKVLSQLLMIVLMWTIVFGLIPQKIASAATLNVSIASGGFSASSITINPGDTVVWTNTDTATHNVSSNNHPDHQIYSPLNLGNVAASATIQLAFNAPFTVSGQPAALPITLGYHDHGIPSLTGTITITDTIAPAAVANLAASTPTSNSIVLTWSAPGDDTNVGTASSYNIRYSTSTINESNFASATAVGSPPTPQANGTSQTVTVTGLQPSTTYYFAMKTTDEANNPSALSNVISLATSAPADTTAPAAISNLASSTVTTNSISLTWTASGDDGATGTASSYNLRYSLSSITESNFASASAVNGVPAPKAAGQAETFAVTGLTPNTSYYFAVKTSDEANNPSGISNIVSASTAVAQSGQDVTAPATITNLATATSTTSSITLTWTSPGDDGTNGTATLYNLRYSTTTINESNFSAATGVNGMDAPKAPGNTETLVVSGLTPGTTYFFALKTSDEAPNPSALSNVVSIATTAAQSGSDATPPATVQNLAASASSAANSLTVTWIASGDDGSTGTATTYNLRYSTSAISESNFNSATAVSSSLSAPKAAGQTETVTVSGLQANTKYFFGLKVIDEASNSSGLSNVVDATTSASSSSSSTSDSTSPGAVTNLAASNPTSNSVTLTWKAPGDDGDSGTAKSYNIRYSTTTIEESTFDNSEAASGTPTPQAAGANESFTVTTLLSNTKYYFAFKAIDDGNNASPLSNVVEATTVAASAQDASPPAGVNDLKTSEPSSTSVKLSWTAPGDDGVIGTATSYDVRYSTSSIDKGNFESATKATTVPAPKAAGSLESMTVTGLQPNTTYYFTLKSADELKNASELSNVVSIKTLASTDEPGASPEAEKSTTQYYFLDSAQVYTFTKVEQATTVQESFAIPEKGTVAENVVVKNDAKKAALVILKDTTLLDAEATAIEHVKLILDTVDTKTLSLPKTITAVKAIEVTFVEETDEAEESAAAEESAEEETEEDAESAEEETEETPDENVQKIVYLSKPATINLTVEANTCTACAVYSYDEMSKKLRYVALATSVENNLFFETRKLLPTYVVVNSLIQKADFKDLKQTDKHWAYSIIKELYNKDIIDGYPDGTFGANNNINRAEAMKLLLTMFDINPVSKAQLKFGDVEKDGWYTSFVKVGFELGIIKGYEEDNTFRPANNINRAEAVAIFARTLKVSKEELDSYAKLPNEFTDVDPEAWYFPYVMYAVEKKIIQGYAKENPDGSTETVFKADQSITRGEFSKLLLKFRSLAS